MYASIIPYCLALITTFAFLPESNKPILRNAKNVTIVIKNDSYLKILGTTNVNTFSCGYVGKIAADTLSIHMQWEEDRILLNDAILEVEVARFDCGQSVMNKDFRKLLQYEEFPDLKINILSLMISSQTHYEALAKVNIKIAGKEGVYEVPVRRDEDKEEQYYTGRQAINIRDFSLEPPKKFLGMVEVDEEVVIDFRLNLSLL